MTLRMPMSSRNFKPSTLEIRLNKVRVGAITNLPYDRNQFFL